MKSLLVDFTHCSPWEMKWISTWVLERGVGLCTLYGRRVPYHVSYFISPDPFFPLCPSCFHGPSIFSSLSFSSTISLSTTLRYIKSFVLHLALPSWLSAFISRGRHPYLHRCSARIGYAVKSLSFTRSTKWEKKIVTATPCIASVANNILCFSNHR